MRIDNNHLIVVLRPHKYWGIVMASILRVSTYSRYMDVEGGVRSEWLDEDNSRDLRQLANQCDKLRPENLFAAYANKTVYRNEAAFWSSEDKLLHRYIKQMADRRLEKAVRLAFHMDIPIIFALSDKVPLHITDRLLFRPGETVLPVMVFDRHEEGTAYQLHLRIGQDTISNLSRHELHVLTFQPGFFILDGCVYILGSDFSAQLLLPFLKKAQIDIPRRMENDYFRRFILKNVAKAEIHATGFDIRNTNECLQCGLYVEKAVNGRYLLSLHFGYGHTDYTYGDSNKGRVTLMEEGDSFVFTRQMRDLPEEQSMTEKLLRTGAKLSDSGSVFFDSLPELIDWLRQYAPQLRAWGFDIIQPSDQVYHIGPMDIEQSDTWHGDWLQTDVMIVLDGGKQRIPFRDLRDNILSGELEYMLPNGDRLLIPEEWIERYSELLLTGMPKGKGFQRHKSQMRHLERMTEQEDMPVRPRDIPMKVLSTKLLHATLRPYQTTGLKWLWNHFLAGTGCCLSDEMGLGKTIQTIALLLEYRESTKTVSRTALPGMLFSEAEMSGRNDLPEPETPVAAYHTSLVVAPASVVHNWKNELARFAPSLLACSYTGNISQRHGMRVDLRRYDVVLTTYRTLHNDIDFLSTLQFGIIVFDESQAFKSSTSQIHQSVCQLRGLHRIALSGTPVENNLNELWSLMNVLNPHLLGTIRHFRRAFAAPIARQMEISRMEILRQIIAPYFLKRTKEEVLSDLPARQDEVVICPMTENQASQYASELSKARNAWMDSSVKESQRQIHILTAIQRLRRIANGEGKMNVVFSQLENIRDTRHKVLIFSEYVQLLEQVGDEMTRRSWTYDILTGQTQRREEVIHHFQDTPDCQFFLISLKAGGVGLNLTAADYVFLLDPWWNQAAEEQAIARSHRIGQHSPVFVYRFVSENTLEEQILSLQERKQSLIDSVMPFICGRHQHFLGE